LCFELVGRRKAKEHEDEQKLRIDLSSTWEFPERERGLKQKRKVLV
jgi:hypothetical protein